MDNIVNSRKEYAQTLTYLLQEGANIIDEKIIESKDGKFKIVHFEYNKNFYVYVLSYDDKNNVYIQANNPNHICKEKYGKKNYSYILSWNSMFDSLKKSNEHYEILIKEGIEFDIGIGDGVVYVIKAIRDKIDVSLYKMID